MTREFLKHPTADEALEWSQGPTKNRHDIQLGCILLMIAESALKNRTHLVVGNPQQSVLKALRDLKYVVTASIGTMTICWDKK